MPVLTVRNLPAEVHRALRVRAANHVRSTEAEVRAILEDAVKPEGHLKLGSLLAEIGREARLSDKDIAVFEDRDETAAANRMAVATRDTTAFEAAGVPVINPWQH